MIVGRIQGHPDGFGFLIPEEKNVEDLYLNRREMRRLMHGTASWHASKGHAPEARPV